MPLRKGALIRQVIERVVDLDRLETFRVVGEPFPLRQVPGAEDLFPMIILPPRASDPATSPPFRHLFDHPPGDRYHSASGPRSASFRSGCRGFSRQFGKPARRGHGTAPAHRSREPFWRCRENQSRASSATWSRAPGSSNRWEAPGTIFSSFSHCIVPAASRFIRMTASSRSPTIRSVGARTAARWPSARSGRPPRETTAATSSGCRASSFPSEREPPPPAAGAAQPSQAKLAGKPQTSAPGDDASLRPSRFDRAKRRH